MPRESIRSVVMSAEKDAVKRFLSHVHQSWDQLQVETIQVNNQTTFYMMRSIQMLFQNSEIWLILIS